MKIGHILIIPLLVTFTAATSSCDDHAGDHDHHDHHVQIMKHEDPDQLIYSQSKSDIIYSPVVQYFIMYEQDNPHWYYTESGTSSFIIRFQTKILMDTNYLIHLSSYRQKRRTGNDFIRESIRINYDNLSSRYDSNGNLNMSKCFQYNIRIPLLDTLPNGQCELPAYYEIVSFIPPNQDETKPFIQPTSSVSIVNKYPRLPEGDGLYLGTFKIN